MLAILIVELDTILTAAYKNDSDRYFQTLGNKSLYTCHEMSY